MSAHAACIVEQLCASMSWASLHHDGGILGCCRSVRSTARASGRNDHYSNSCIELHCLYERSRDTVLVPFTSDGTAELLISCRCRPPIRLTLAPEHDGPRPDQQWSRPQDLVDHSPSFKCMLTAPLSLASQCPHQAFLATTRPTTARCSAHAGRSRGAPAP